MFKNGTTRVNVKARLSRHLRIVKENIGVDSPNKAKEKMNFHFKIVLFFVFLVIPVYPSLASFMYNNSRYDFYRGDIDESSIIESYYGGNDQGGDQIGPMMESTDSFLSVNTILDDERDISGTNEIVNYEVKPGDSFNSISFNFKVSTNSIFWANDFTKNHTLHPGEVIKVPPVSGLIHQVKPGDTISSIAKKYDIGESKIFEQNGMEKGGKLIAGEVLVIPGAIKKLPPKPIIIPPKNTGKLSNKGKSYTNSNNGGGSKNTSNPGKYSLTKKQGSNTFYWGNCTWYVAQYKKVTWNGNANEWLSNARAAGKSTGSSPSVGAIVQFNGRGYNPRYGHVGIVTDVVGGEIIVSDMNYRRLNEVTTRKVSVNDRSIQGYIYVD